MESLTNRNMPFWEIDPFSGLSERTRDVFFEITDLGPGRVFLHKVAENE